MASSDEDMELTGEQAAEEEEAEEDQESDASILDELAETDQETDVSSSGTSGTEPD